MDRPVFMARAYRAAKAHVGSLALIGIVVCVKRGRDIEPSSPAVVDDVVRSGLANAMPSVLVIEDDPDMREIERATLDCAGHEVVLASNGREGLQVLEQYRPCVILLDLMMPVMDGLTFLSERRKRRIAEDVPVLCITAGGADMKQHALTLGARECLNKPTDWDHLCDRIRHYCG